jgi:hypothetical protein|nr:hypothetical protein [uncultured Psychroserpens sp.]
MKSRLLILSAFLAITSLIIYGCSSTSGLNSYVNKTICSNYSREPVSELPIKLIVDMIDGYQDNQLSEINSGLAMNDARAISFDLETLKKFIYHIETITKDKDSTISSEDIGIRIYYAKYPDESKWGTISYKNALDGFRGDPITEQYENKHTLLLMPTIKRNDTYFDFNPNDQRTYTKQMNELTEQQQEGSQPIYTNSTNTTIGLSLMPSSSSRSLGTGSSSTVAQNHGGLFPPNSDSGFGFNN